MLGRLILKIADSVYQPKIAHTLAEKEAVFRFRYQIYIQKMHKNTSLAVDHENKMLYDESDYADNAIIFYIEESGQIIATVTYRIWDKGTFPQYLRAKYEVDKFPFANQLTLGEGRFLLINKKNKLVLAAINNAFSKYLIANKIVLDILFLACMPGLVSYYIKAGFRFYSNHYVLLKDGLHIPLLFIPYDLAYFAKQSYLFIDMIKQYTQAITGRYEKSLELIRSFLANNTPSLQSVVFNKKAIQQLIKDSELDAASCKLLTVLSLKELSSLVGLMLRIPANTYIIKGGAQDKEIYIILEGAVDVEIDQVRISTLSKGSVFGEMAFFLEEGRRSADIYTTTATTVAVIRRNDATRIMKKNPKLAINFLFILSQIVCMRLASVIKAYSLVKDKK